MAKCILVFSLLLALNGGCDAWWCTGHLLVAEIAYSKLSAPAKLAADKYSQMMADQYPDSPDFTQSACWADDIKKNDNHLYDTWHYTNLPFVNRTLLENLPSLNDAHNVVWAIEEASDILASDKSKDLDKAFAMRLVTHMIGDIHQPLHTVTQYSDPDFKPPEGDQGGNYYKIKTGKYGQMSLHMFWDSGALQWHDLEPERPMNTSTRVFYEGIASDIMKEFPQTAGFGELKRSHKRPDGTKSATNDWVNEVYDIAVGLSYTTPQGVEVAAEYETQGQMVCRKLVALAGYRLAQTLNSIFV